MQTPGAYGMEVAMSPSLPARPSLEQLKKQAKDLVKGGAGGDPAACETLRRLRRFRRASDAEVRVAEVALHEAQFALAMGYGFTSWAELKTFVESAAPPEQVPTVTPEGKVLEYVRAVFERERDPLYQRCEMWALMLLLHSAGRTDVDYATLMAVSGWSGQFVYVPAPDWPSFVPPGPTVEKACAAVGFEVETAVPETPEETVDFVAESVDMGRPVMVPFYEEALFNGYGSSPEGPTVHFLCMPFADKGAWWGPEELRTKWWDKSLGRRLRRLGEAVEPKDPTDVAVETMESLVRLATEDYWTNERAPDALTGLRAMERYAEDIADVGKGMQKDEDDTSFFERGWGCYAVYPQWTARECTARYLTEVAPLFDAPVSDRVRRAAEAYRGAYGHWREWERHLGRSKELGGYDERWADPERRQDGVKAVRKTIAAEREALESVRGALDALRA